jgi:hypothetical protein
MKQCGRCGAQNLDQQAVCTGCGLALPAAAAGLGGTMVMSPPQQPPQPPAEPAQPPRNLRGTMIGIAPPTFASPAVSPEPGQPPGAATPPAPAPATASQPPPRQFAGTMIGMAPPTFPSPPPPPDVAPPAGPIGAPRISSAQKTVLGVARPGIAPLNPGQAKVAPPAAAAPAAVPPAVPRAHGGGAVAWAPVAAPGSGRGEGPPSPRAPQPRRISITATIAIVGSAMLLVMAVVAFFMLRGHGSVTARASLDKSGNEQLDLSCSECPDGTKAWIDAAPVAFQNGKASLRLQAPLKVGENPILLVLERPGRSREEIALSLPIEFRVRSSTEELAQDTPKVSVVASALSGTKLEVDGKSVPPDPNGVVRFDYEVTADVVGPEASVKTLERIVPYKAISAVGTQTGQIEIRLGITPLIVDAPGASIIVGDKEVVIAGRTAPGATLKIGAQSIALDQEGRFVSKQSLASGENSFTVRSTLKDLAPRLVKVSVRRSDNLEREASLARSRAQTSYAEVVRAGDAAIGRIIAISGQLFDVRHDGYSSVLLVDVKDGCKKASCLSKVIYGVQTTLEKGRGVKAFGKVVRFVDGPRTGERIPEVRADLVVAGTP